MNKFYSFVLVLVSVQALSVYGSKKPNIILIFADDISARELPFYGTPEWAPPIGLGINSKDEQFRAKTPALDRLAERGAVAQTAWATPVCSPSRATIMTGRYAHLHKWWQNNDIGKYRNEKGLLKPWPIYKSSPHLISHVARDAGYNTYWVGKTQMNKGAPDMAEFGFDVVVSSPGGDIGVSYKDFDLSDFIHRRIETTNSYGEKPEKVSFVSEDTGLPLKAVWPNASFFWQPFFATYNYPRGSNDSRWWPQNKEERKRFGLSTFGPDVEMRFSLEFIEESHREGRPFFIYHTSHLGHTAFNYLGQIKGKKREQVYPGTPIISWNGEAYERVEPKITGDRGVYNTHGTVTDPGMHHHVEYLDFQVWQYLEKLKELDIHEDTVILFLADNGTVGYGKMRLQKQRGPLVPFYIYIPGMSRRGMQDILVDITDILPTIADLTGTELPTDYEINGTSLLPFLNAETDRHRDWIYSYLYEKQMARGHLVMRDGEGSWWDVSSDPSDLDSYPRIEGWSKVSEAHRAERDELKGVLQRFDKHATEHGAPSQ